MAVTEAVILGPVIGLLGALLLDLLLRGGKAWWWQQLAAFVRRGRSRYRGWRRDRCRRRVEAGLDKVEELVGKEADCKAVHPFRWPMELKRLWCEAAGQLIHCDVNWRVPFPKYGAIAWVGDDVMHVQWGKLTIHGSADGRRFGGGGDVDDLAGWALRGDGPS